ncbi:metallophosphoesterase family protein [Lampropedia puyangensis]|nr:metallophosphoesterase [Lampropedia puyangensis]
MSRYAIKAACLVVTLPFSAALFAQNAVVSESFDTASPTDQVTDTPPEGWTISTYYTDDLSSPVALSQGKPEWLGWKFVQKATWNRLLTPNSSNQRAGFNLASNGIAVAESDGLRPLNGRRFTTKLSSAAFPVEAGQSYSIAFDSHYLQGQKPQNASAVAVFSNGSTHTLVQYDIDTLDGQNHQPNRTLSQTVTVPNGATTVNVQWLFDNTANNWYWAIDNLRIEKKEVEVAPPFDSSALPQSNKKPTMTVSPTLQGPGPDRMVVMFETTEAEPTVWVRKHGSSEAYTIVAAKNAEGNLADEKIFFAAIEGLDSNTLYEYAVITGNSLAPKLAGPYAFKTWPKEGDGVDKAHFITVSDTQDGLQERFKNIIEQGVLALDCGGSSLGCAQNIAAMLVPGDLVSTGSARAQWANHFFAPMQAISAYVPIIPAPGNHEYYGEDRVQSDTNAWMKTYRKYFYQAAPSESEKYPQHWFHTDYLGLRIISSDFNPASAMHNTSGWNTATYDFGRTLFREDYMREHLNWFTNLMADTKAKQKSHVFLLNHHPCLSTKWRGGEVVAACDFIAQLESYGEQTGAITANLNGHVHTYERGNSMNARHLWLTVASASGDLEPAQMPEDTDLDVFVNTDNAFGYGRLRVDFGKTKALQWERHNLRNNTISSVPDDAIEITNNTFNAKPVLPQRFLGQVEPDTVTLAYSLPNQADVYEAQWQVSQHPSFSNASATVFDVWGDKTRRESWTYIGKTRTNTQAGSDISQLALGEMLNKPARLYPNQSASTPIGQLYKQIVPGANDLAERWDCARRWDSNGDTAGQGRQGGRQCFAQLTNANGEKVSAFNPFGNQPIPVLAFANQQQWFWRVRVRDAHLNWSDWSDTGSFQLGETLPTPAAPVLSQLLSGSGLANSSLEISSTASCQAAQARTTTAAAIHLDIPAGWQAPYGAISFELEDCNQLGFNANVALTFDAALPEGAMVKKFNTTTGEMHDIAGLNITGNRIDYTVTDGGELDEDGQINGSIHDPLVVLTPVAAIAPAQATPVPANPVWSMAGLAALLLLLGARHHRRQSANA